MVSFQHLLNGLAWLAVLASAAPTTELAVHHDDLRKRALPTLRIMPLGDSITKGNGSPDGNGYRQKLQQLIKGDGAEIDYIGSLRSGGMADNDHEGHSGEYLASIRTYVSLSIGARPNVVLVHAGTNDVDKDVDLPNAPARLAAIIDSIYDAEPNAVILVAKIVWANDPRMQANTDAFNARVDGIVSSRQSQGVKALTVDMSRLFGTEGLADRKHPNGNGYTKMAQAWFEGLQTANGRGWIKSPTPSIPGGGGGIGIVVPGDDPGCAGSGRKWQSKGQIFDKARVWEELGTVAPGPAGASRSKLRVADLNGDGKVDYILVEDDGTVKAWLNTGNIPKTGDGASWRSIGSVGPSGLGGVSGFSSDKVRFADVDGDGAADLLLVYAGGAIRAWKNNGQGTSFSILDAGWAAGVSGVSGDMVQIADMDGDGYADFVTVDGSGAVRYSRNTHNNGKDASKRNFDAPVTIAPGVSGVSGDKVRLWDLDGDGKADYVIVYDGGAVSALRNTGHLMQDTTKRSWEYLGVIAPGVSGVTGNMIIMADLDGDGAADFLAVSPDGAIRALRNTGAGLGGGDKGASLRFANLNGDGAADIVQVGPGGKCTGWLSVNKGDSFRSVGEIAPGPSDNPSADQVHFADVDGDGLDDYLVVFDTGAVKAWLNLGNIGTSSGGRIWSEAISIAPGVGEPGSKVRFADLNGDGKADYLILYDGGAVKAYLNRGNIPPRDGGRIWHDGVTVATGVAGAPGSKIQFADLNGDGKAEYLVVWDGGAVEAYRNNGNIPNVGMARNWGEVGVVAPGVTPQGPVQFADIDGDGKADYLTVFEDGSVNAYINVCALGSNTGNNGGPGTGIGIPSLPELGDGILTPGASCTAIEEYQDAVNKSPTPREVWAKLNGTGYLENWYFNGWNPDEDSSSYPNIAQDFAEPWGLYDSFKCTLNKPCEVPNCRDFDDAPGSARAYIVMKSLAQLSQTLNKVWDAYRQAATDFDSVKTLVQQEIWPSIDRSSSSLSDVINALSAVGGMAFGLVGGMAPLTGTIGGGALAYLGGVAASAAEETHVDQSLKHLAQIEKMVAQGSDYVRRGIDELHVAIFNRGSTLQAIQRLNLNNWKGEGMRADMIWDVVDGGRWLDGNEIPILNSNALSIEKLTRWFKSFIFADVVNYAWRQQNVAMVSYPMDKSTFDRTRKDIDLPEQMSRWHDGRGYYLQSYYDNGEDAIAREPPGWEALGRNKAPGFDVASVLESSILSAADGYNARVEQDPVRFIRTSGRTDITDVTPEMKGVFNMPHCHIDMDDVDLDDFISGVDTPDRRPNKSMHYYSSAICRCEDQKDKNGKKFFDQMKDGDRIIKTCNYFFGFGGFALEGDGEEGDSGK